MVRFRWIRSRLKEIAKSSKIERILLVFPFIILFLDLYMLNHALRCGDADIIIAALILFIFSLSEIVVTFDEIHEHAVESVVNRKISSRVRNLVKNSDENLTVKRAMEISLKKYPELKKYRKKLYHVICQVLSEEE